MLYRQADAVPLPVKADGLSSNTPNSNSLNNYHGQEVKAVLRSLQTTRHGLSEAEAAARLQQHGPNTIPEKGRESLLLKFFKQFHNVLIYTLLVATAISFYLGHYIDAYLILSIVLLNALIGFVQEYRADRSIQALKALMQPQASVYRDGKLMLVDAQTLVPGDILHLKDGDKIPADGRVILSNNLKTVESSITGESLPEDKEVGALPEDTPLAEQSNMVWMGTYVGAGEALVAVTTTGAHTTIGQLAESLETINPKQNLFKKRVNRLALQLGILAFVVATITFVVGYFVKGYAFTEIFLFTLASLVGSIPEGLPAIIIIVLVIGARRMVRRRSIIRSLPATETLGHTTVILTDKTGTLTQNTMTIQDVVMPGAEHIKVSGTGWETTGQLLQDEKPVSPEIHSGLEKVVQICALCNSATVAPLSNEEGYEVIGDPTEAALVVLAHKAGITDDDEAGYSVLTDMPFRKELRYRATLVKNEQDDSREVFVVGAPEELMRLSDRCRIKGEEVSLSEERRSELEQQLHQLTSRGLRVLGLAYKPLPAGTDKLHGDCLEQLVFAGLVGMKDPARPEVLKALEATKRAGIKVIMQTGDHPDTARAIAREIGMLPQQDNNQQEEPPVLTGRQLEQLTEKEFRQTINKVNVLARMNPALKMKVVEQLQEQGEIVAKTGDGTNDAPALKQADVGISMGIIGTDVAKDASDLVLADDNFATIVEAVRQGRIVFRNIRQVIYFLLTTNIAEGIAIISALMIGMELPLLPVHILWLNLITDGIVVLALAAEPEHEDSLNAPPETRKGFIQLNVIPFFIMIAGIMTASTLYIFNSFYHEGIDKARTGAFLMLAMAQLFNVLNMRSLKESIFRIGLFSNKYLFWGMLFSVLPILLIVYVPFLKELFRFEAIGIRDMLIIVGLASTVLVAGELYKLVRKWIVQSKG